MKYFHITNADGEGYVVLCETDKEFEHAVMSIRAELEVMREDEYYDEVRSVSLVDLKKEEVEKIPEFDGW